MTVVGIVLLIILAVVLLALLLLFLKASVRIVYGEKLCVYVGLSVFKFKVYPKSENKKKKKDKLKNDKKSAVTESEKISDAAKNVKADEDDSKQNEISEESAEKDKDKKKKGTLTDTLSFIGDIIKKVGQTFGKHGEIDVNELVVTVSEEQAADTAVKFGIACSGVSTVLALCSLFGKSKIKSENVMVIPDFITGKGSLSADFKIAIRPIFAILAAIEIFVKKMSKKV